MKNYIKLAWRNLWRNKRRTLITVASIFFGVLLSAYMSSMQEGSYGNMVDVAVKFYSGSIQIHKKGYWEEQKLNNAFKSGKSIGDKIENTEGIDFYTRRLESFALASSETITKGVMVLGIEPENENKVTAVKDKMKKGNYLKQGDEGVVISQGLAKYLKLNVNDTLVMIGQGYHGVSAAGKFPIRGILKHPNPEFNKMLVYLDIERCQDFYSAKGLLSSYVIMIDDYDNLDKIKNNISYKLSDDYEVMTWSEIQPALVQQINSDRAGGVLMKGMLYLVIGFGILATIMMMMAERKREFGVIIAVGMQKYKLKIILLIETFFISLIGVFVGIGASIPLNYFYYLNPIHLKGKGAEAMLEYGFEPVMKFSMDAIVFYNQAITIFIITLFIAIYPIYYI
ncbi:MAG: FtsX-like permease family protein, partial [Bacteroidota bacterium]|nr:FtsX-like permease family protein [Bacteroidota bacterium]